MLLELTVSNFAIIEHLRLALGPHLDVFTGETGAGKSIIVDAISALVGERVTSEVVRAGSDRAAIEGIFDVAPLLQHSPQAQGAPPDDGAAAPPEGETLAEVLADLGIEPEDGTLILAREITRAGRGVARINGRAVPLSALQRISASLIDIHGQSAHLALLRPEQHVYYLDRYANTVELRGQVADLVGRWRAVRREYERLQRDEREVERRIELLRYQVDEITAARLRPGELEELERERRLLTNAERLTTSCAAAHAALAGDETDDSPGALDLLAGAQHALADLLRLDDTLKEQAATLDQALFLLEDVAAGLRSYQEDVAADPQRQAEVEERLDLIAKLRRKYGATIEEILAFAAESSAELETLAHREERAAELHERERELRDQIGALAADLSRRRREASEALAAAMERELGDLNMQRARFRIEIEHSPDPDGVPADLRERASATVKGAAGEHARPDTYAFTATGIDRVEFTIAPNPGEPFKPLARIASGGETSRLMLALKTILSHADAVPILIFDEIDTGISGRSGQVVGEKLWHLGQAHQVLCVTHLAQIAALADNHYRVAKIVEHERTHTTVEPLTADERAEEIGQMLGGAKTRAAQANAVELLERAAVLKREPLPKGLPA